MVPLSKYVVLVLKYVGYIVLKELKQEWADFSSLSIWHNLFNSFIYKALAVTKYYLVHLVFAVTLGSACKRGVEYYLDKINNVNCFKIVQWILGSIKKVLGTME